MPQPVEPFATFMARALYDPERGYYAKRIRTVGARGDFSTSATLSPLLGQAVAGWVMKEGYQDLGLRDVIEVGGGDGSLMAGVLQTLGWWRRRRFGFHVVETSPVLLDLQKQRLAKRGVTWHTDLREALQQCGGRALIYHNELVDAFPVTLIEWDAESQTWQEVWLARSAQGFSEKLQPLSLSPEEGHSCSVLRKWTSASPPPHPKQRCELHLSVRRWLQSWAPHWRAGAMLTIDYGDVFPDLYHRRPDGTLRAYLLQQRIEGSDVYANFGRQDITADVNFTDYCSWAKDLGWQEEAFGTQAELIQTHAKEKVCDAIDARLTDPQGAGAAFKFVIHRRL